MILNGMEKTQSHFDSTLIILRTLNSFRSVSDSISMPPLFLFDFDLSLSSTLHFGIILVSLQLHVDFASTSLRFYSDSTCVSLRSCFEFMSITFGFHFDFALTSFGFHLVLISSLFRSVLSTHRPMELTHEAKSGDLLY